MCCITLLLYELTWKWQNWNSSQPERGVPAALNTDPSTSAPCTGRPCGTLIELHVTQAFSFHSHPKHLSDFLLLFLFIFSTLVVSPESLLSCSSAFSRVDKMLSVSSGRLPTTAKPFHTYIISCETFWHFAINKTGYTFYSTLMHVFLTNAGTTSFWGFGRKYLCAFFAANFSVGTDFPAIFNRRPSTCLQSEDHFS